MKKVYYYSESQYKVVKSLSLIDKHFNPNNKINGKSFTECKSFKDDEEHPVKNNFADSYVAEVIFVKDSK